MSLCPESEFRDSLSEPEFWDYVLLGIRPGDPQPDGYEWEPDEPELSAPPCPLCGALGACAYDPEGLPLIHAIEDEDEAP